MLLVQRCLLLDVPPASGTDKQQGCCLSSNYNQPFSLRGRRCHCIRMPPSQSPVMVSPINVCSFTSKIGLSLWLLASKSSATLKVSSLERPGPVRDRVIFLRALGCCACDCLYLHPTCIPLPLSYSSKNVHPRYSNHSDAK